MSFGSRGVSGPSVVWLTGLPSAGKSTLARALHVALRHRQLASYVLDGDELRQGLCRDLGFAPQDRDENIRRVGEVARLFANAGVLAIVALISPYRAGRDAARALVAAGRFIEVHVKCDLTTCEARDPKGLYRRARAGLLKDFTGVDAPYESPLRPELVLDTTSSTVEACVAQLLELVQERPHPTSTRSPSPHSS